MCARCLKPICHRHQRDEALRSIMRFGHLVLRTTVRYHRYDPFQTNDIHVSASALMFDNQSGLENITLRLIFLGRRNSTQKTRLQVRAGKVTTKKHILKTKIPIMTIVVANTRATHGTNVVCDLRCRLVPRMSAPCCERQGNWNKL